MSNSRFLATSMSLMTRMSIEEMWRFGLLTLDPCAIVRVSRVNFVISRTDTVILEG